MIFLRLSSVLALLMCWAITGCEISTDNPAENPSQDIQDSTATVSDTVQQVETDSFGIDITNLTVTEDRVRRGDTFTRILERQGLSRSDAHNIGRSVQPDFNVRRVVVGRSMKFYHPEDDPSDLKHIVYQQGSLQHTHIDLAGDSVIVEQHHREPDTEIRYAEGTIVGSLYETLLAGNHSPKLAYDLSNIFAWQLDFHRIRRGDQFRVIYEEKYLDDKRIGIGEIKVAQFTHLNDDYFAFRYEEEGSEYYYDEYGNSLRRSYKRAPLRYSRISSHFTDNRYHPVLGRNMPHHGVDYAAPRGTPVYAVGDGTITEATYGRNNGNYIRIRHNSVHESGYLHLNRIAQGISPGTEVEQGEVIGYVGSTGLATGPHLCYRFWENGHPVDPLDVDADPVDPLAEEYMDDYEEHIFGLMRWMQELPQQEDRIGEPAIGTIIKGEDLINLVERQPVSGS